MRQQILIFSQIKHQFAQSVMRIIEKK